MATTFWVRSKFKTWTWCCGYDSARAWLNSLTCAGFKCHWHRLKFKFMIHDEWAPWKRMNNAWQIAPLHTSPVYQSVNRTFGIWYLDSYCQCQSQGSWKFANTWETLPKSQNPVHGCHWEILLLLTTTWFVILFSTVLIEALFPKMPQSVFETGVHNVIPNPRLECRKQWSHLCPKEALLGHIVSHLASTPAVQQRLGKTVGTLHLVCRYWRDSTQIIEKTSQLMYPAAHIVIFHFAVLRDEPQNHWRKLNVHALVALCHLPLHVHVHSQELIVGIQISQPEQGPWKPHGQKGKSTPMLTHRLKSQVEILQCHLLDSQFWKAIQALNVSVHQWTTKLARDKAFENLGRPQRWIPSTECFLKFWSPRTIPGPSMIIEFEPWIDFEFESSIMNWIMNHKWSIS